MLVWSLLLTFRHFQCSPVHWLECASQRGVAYSLWYQVSTLCAVLNLHDSRRSSPFSSFRQHSELDDDETMEGPFNTQHFHEKDATPTSGQLTTSRIAWGNEQDDSVPGSPTKPVRLLVCVSNEASEPVLVPSFMHLQICVIVQFAVGFLKAQEAIIQNEKVRKPSCAYTMHLKIQSISCLVVPTISVCVCTP